MQRQESYNLTGTYDRCGQNSEEVIDEYLQNSWPKPNYFLQLTIKPDRHVSINFCADFHVIHKTLSSRG